LAQAPAGEIVGMFANGLWRCVRPAGSVLMIVAAAAVPALASEPPRFFVTPTSIDFGPVGVGQTSANVTVVIRNSGFRRLESFTGGAPFDPQFSATQNCAGGVAPGASCQYTFNFTPTSAGTFTTTSQSGTNLGPFVIQLRGTGVGPRLHVTPLSLDFGWVPLDTTSPSQSVTIRNDGLSVLSAFAGGAPFDPQFSATQNCASGVAPGASCQYTFSFRPTATGAAMTTSNSSTNAGPITIALQGRGGAPPAGAVLAVTPLSLDFGRVGLATTSANQIVTIRNQGTVTLGSFAGGAPFDPQFSATQNCASGVAPGASCQYTFRFTPTSAGTFTTTSNTNTNAGPFVIQLRGTGVGAEAVPSPLAIDFGPVPLGTTSAAQVVTIRNVGLATLGAFAGGAPFDPQFSATQNCASGVAPGASCQYTFRFAPTGLGAAQTTSSSSTNGGALLISLRGFGIPEGVIFFDGFEP
jgi:hypothetical protein